MTPRKQKTLLATSIASVVIVVTYLIQNATGLNLVTDICPILTQ